MTEELDDIELLDGESDLDLQVEDGQLYEHLRMEVDRGQEPVRAAEEYSGREGEELRHPGR